MKFDAVVIGSGIGGLVCASYLSKAGIKVLVVEKHDRPGGYCSSFQRKGYHFDVGVHYLGGIKKGVLGRILKELELEDEIVFKQFDPVDKIVMPENITYIRANPKDTIGDFKKSFPLEIKSIERFFKFIMQEDVMEIYKKTKNLTFKGLLDEFFSDFKLKATMGVLLGNIGTSYSETPAFTGVVLYRQYILDPGYYPKGGMQAFPEVLVRHIEKNGGELRFSRKIVKIHTKDNKVKEVEMDNGEVIKADIVVSNADATQTFLELLDVKSKELTATEKLIPSPSLFLLYLGLDKSIRTILDNEYNIWYFSTYQIDKIHSDIKKNLLQDRLPWVVSSFPSLHDVSNKSADIAAMLLILAPFETPEFWGAFREALCEKMLDKISELVPNFNKYVKFKISATPRTLHKYTLNRNGSFVGWLSSVNQTKSHLLPQSASIHGLYLVGTWCTLGYPGQGGIPNVAASGRRGAMLALSDIGRAWDFENITL